MEIRAHYLDGKHDCPIVIRNEKRAGGGYDLRFTLDGFTFIGNDFCDFELEDPAQAEAAAGRFNLLKWGGFPLHGEKAAPYSYSLQRCAMEMEIPVKVLRRRTDQSLTGLIRYACHMEPCGRETARSRTFCDGHEVYPDRAVCTEFCLEVDGSRFPADRPTTYFEQALLQICRKCGGEYLLHCCFTCQYSDYSPYGCDDFGSMLCYRRHKAVYLTVNDKDGYFEKLEGLDCDVEQETNVCGEFEERIRCDGYRGRVGMGE